MSLKPSHVCNIFDKINYPILSSGCEAWGFTPGMYLERLHLKFCKQILGVKQNRQNEFVYGEPERYSLIINIIVKFWLKVSNDLIQKKCYNLMLYNIIVFPNKMNWLSML